MEWQSMDSKCWTVKYSPVDEAWFECLVGAGTSAVKR